MILQPFNYSHMPSLIDRLVRLWSGDTPDENFNRIYVEAIIRQNMCDESLQFEHSQNGELHAITFCAKKNQHHTADSWWTQKFNSLTEEQQKAFKMSRDYLSYMDNKTYSHMTDNDIKLCLYVSTKPGSGKVILDQAMARFKNEGYKNMYLWTDCDCNYNWYFNNGFELVEEEVYSPFTHNNREYKTFIFKIAL